MVAVFMLLAVLALIGGVLTLSQVTGVGLVGIACFFAICAHLAQASSHHDKLVGALKRQTEQLADAVYQQTTRQP